MKVRPGNQAHNRKMVYYLEAWKGNIDYRIVSNYGLLTMDYRDSLFVIVNSRESCEGTPLTVPLITFAQNVLMSSL